MRLSDPTLVQRANQDMIEYGKLGGLVDSKQLARLEETTSDIRQLVRMEQQELRRKIRELIKETEDDLIRVRIQGRSVNAIFSETILFLLVKVAMTTVEINDAIAQLHPDLCDNSTDRVIDGQHFGKLWKHRVRGAQVYLKSKNLISYDAGDRLWRLHEP